MTRIPRNLILGLEAAYTHAQAGQALTCSMFMLCKDHILRPVFNVGENIAEAERMLTHMATSILASHIKLRDSTLKYAGIWFAYLNQAATVPKLEYSKSAKPERADTIPILLPVIPRFSKDARSLLPPRPFEDRAVRYWRTTFIPLHQPYEFDILLGRSMDDLPALSRAYQDIYLEILATYPNKPA